MMKHLIFSLAACALLIPPMAVANGGDVPNWWRTQFTDTYVQPVAAELAMLQDLIRRQLQGRAVPVAADWAALGLERRERRAADRDFIVITEAPERRDGRGMLIFAPDAAQQSTYLQIPHGRTDLYTGEIGLQLMIAHPISAAVLNTSKRSVAVQDQHGNTLDEVADLGKLDNSLLVALTKAVAELIQPALIVQLHGFAAKKRKHQKARQAAMIISHGTRQSSAYLRGLENCLSRYFERAVLVYPDDVDELGGTKNVVVGLLRRDRGHMFLHVEIDKPTRQLLKQSTASRADLVSCLG